MKNSVKKIVALSLCAALTAGMAGCAAPAAIQEEAPTFPVSAGQLAASDGAAAVPYKDETVYVLAGADGSVEKVIVSDWLKNPTGSAFLRDATSLTGVENVKGVETYTQEGGALVWDARGGDIYCQGSSDQALPVEMKVTYMLDGKAVSAEELAGKSGKVTIRFDYTNNEYEMVEIDGKQEKIYVPFAMLTGLALDSEKFTNVEVSSGRVLSDGSRTVVAGLAFPGLQESLALDPEKLEIPSYVEVTADVQNFELANTVTIAVSDLFSEVDTDELDSADDLEDALTDLTDAMDQLMDGSSRLYDGLCQLLDKSGQLVDGINQLAAGTQALQSGANDLTAGAQALASGAGSLAQGAQSLHSGLEDLTAGAGQLQTGAEQLQAGAASLQTGAANLQAGLEALASNNEQLTGGAKQVFDTLLTSAAGQLKAAGLELPELTAENYAAVLDGVLAQLPEEAAGPVAAVKTSLDSYNAFYQGLVNYTAGVSEAAGGAAQVTGGAEQVSGGAAGLAEGAEQLSGGAEALQDGAAALDAGAGQVSGGAEALAEGAEQLSGGIGQVKDGVDALQAAAPDLIDGVTQLRDGALELSDGLKEFNEQGIQKLVDAVDGDLNGLVERLRAVVDAAKGYQTFSGGGDGQVKFVYRTEAVELEK